MANEVKTIGVLTSGGDAPGMNAAIRAVVRAGIHKGMRVMGIRRGYNGLINGDMVEMGLRDVSDIIQRGGTMLYTARCKKFREEAGVQKAVDVCKEYGIDGIVVIGGDGSFRGARDLSLKGIPCVGIPGTIDNDIACSEYTVGYDTAMNTAMYMVDKIRDTSQSHDRCSVVEVMGRHAGHIALNTGIACGASAVLVPEIPYDLENELIPKIEQTRKMGKQHFIIVMAEGVSFAARDAGIVEKPEDYSKYVAETIEKATGIESRATVLGHVQRGGSPTVRDRVVASQMGYEAVQLLSKGIVNRVVAMQQSEIVNFDIYEALAMKKTIDEKLYEIAGTISI